VKDFEQRVAVVTGAASGLGLEFARSAARRGMKVVLADVQQESLGAAVEQIRAEGVQAIGVKTDVSRAADVEALASATQAAFGKVHVLFNNAGVTSGGLVWENSPRDWDWVLGVNLHGVIHGVRTFTPLMLAQAASDPGYQGHIVNTASMAGLLVGPAMGIYSVSKHAVVALSEALFHDLSLVTSQVHCSVLCPSYVPTNIGNSDRNRPQALANDAPLTKSQAAARAISQSSINAGSLTAEQVSELTFDAIGEQRFPMFPHQQALALVRQRMETFVDQRNPLHSFEGSPDRAARRQQLLEAVRQ